jgi:hypothetical protein
MEEIREKIDGLIKKMEACGADLSCMEKTTKAINQLSEQLQQTESGFLQSVTNPSLKSSFAPGIQIIRDPQMTQTLFRFASDPCEVLEKYKTDWNKHYPGHKLPPFPGISTEVGVFESCLPVLVKLSHVGKKKLIDRCGNTVESVDFDYDAEHEGEVWFNRDFETYYLRVGNLTGRRTKFRINQAEGFRYLHYVMEECRGDFPRRYDKASVVTDPVGDMALLISDPPNRDTGRFFYHPVLIEFAGEWQFTALGEFDTPSYLYPEAKINFNLTSNMLRRMWVTGPISTVITSTAEERHPDGAVMRLSNRIDLEIQILGAQGVFAGSPDDDSPHSCILDPSGPDEMRYAMRVGALLGAGGDKLIKDKHIGAGLIDQMRASLEKGFRGMVASMSNTEIIERALHLHDMLFKDKIVEDETDPGPQEKSAIAETLLEMHKELNKRIKIGKNGLPVLEGVKLNYDDPTGGIVEGIQPFNMVGWWRGFIIPPDKPQEASHGHVDKKPSTSGTTIPIDREELIPETRIEITDDELLRRAAEYVKRSKSTNSRVKRRTICLLNKLRESSVDDRVVKSTAYLLVNQPPAIFCGHPDSYTFRFRPEVLKELRRAKNAKQIVQKALKKYDILHGESWKIGQAIEKQGQASPLTLNKAQKKLRKWLGKRQTDPRSIYSCFEPFR